MTNTAVHGGLVDDVHEEGGQVGHQENAAEAQLKIHINIETLE